MTAKAEAGLGLDQEKSTAITEAPEANPLRAFCVYGNWAALLGAKTEGIWSGWDETVPDGELHIRDLATGKYLGKIILPPKKRWWQ